jgi:hypothetical protein
VRPQLGTDTGFTTPPPAETAESATIAAASAGAMATALPPVGELAAASATAFPLAPASAIGAKPALAPRAPWALNDSTNAGGTVGAAGPLSTSLPTPPSPPAPPPATA